MKKFKIAVSLVALTLVMILFASCSGNEKNTSFDNAISFDDASSEWKPSLLDKAGLSTIAEPKGEKEFIVDEKGNLTFTVTPSDEETVSSFASGIFSEIKNYTDEINPSSFDKAWDSEKHFKIKYAIDGVNVSLELFLEQSVLKTVIIYS